MNTLHLRACIGLACLLVGVGLAPARAVEKVPSVSKFDVAFAVFHEPRADKSFRQYGMWARRKWNGVSTSVKVIVSKFERCKTKKSNGGRATTKCGGGRSRVYEVDPGDFEFNFFSGARVVVKAGSVIHRMRWKVPEDAGPLPDGDYYGGSFCSDGSYESGQGPYKQARAKGNLFGKKFSSPADSFLATGVMTSEGSCPDGSGSWAPWRFVINE